MRSARREREKFISLLVLIAIIILFSICNNAEHSYSMQGFVVKQEGDVLTVEDKMGLKWHYVTREEFTENEKIKIYFFTSLTHSTRDDDEVTKIKRLEKDLTNR